MSDTSRVGKWWPRAIVAVVLALCFRALSTAEADPDLWGHVRFGQRTLEAGEIERTDPFSYLTQGQEWINHEWLSEVTFGALFNAGGSAALVWLRLVIGLLMVALMYRHLMKRGLDPLRGALVLVGPAMLWIYGLLLVRPQMFTFLGFALTLLAIEAAERGHERAAWWIPLICAVWINFHGGVLAGIGVLGVWWFGRLVHAAVSGEQTARAVWSHLRLPTLVGLASVAALLLNPYGWELPEFLLRTGTVRRPDITEWWPLSLSSPLGLMYLAILGGAIATLWRARTRTPLVVLWIVIAYLPHTAIRHVPLFGIATVALLADPLARAWKREAEPAVSSIRPVVIAGLVLAALVSVVTSIPNLSCVRINPGRVAPFPARAVAWLEASGVEGNMATFFDWGEYVLWHLAPRVKISMDGRRETVYADSIYEEYQRFQNGIGDWDDLVDRPETELVLMSKNWPTPNLMELEPGWTRVYDDSLAAVFAREGSPQLARLRLTTAPDLPYDGAGMCSP